MAVQPVLHRYLDCVRSLSTDPFPIQDLDKKSSAFKEAKDQFSKELSSLNPDVVLSSDPLSLDVDPKEVEYLNEIRKHTPRALIKLFINASAVALTFFNTLKDRHCNGHFKLPPTTLVRVPENTVDLFHLILCGHGFETVKKLGEGTYGKVVLHKLNDLKIADKTYDHTDADTALRNFGSLQRELCAYASLSHKNIVKMLGCYKSANRLHLYFEYMNYGSLYDYLNRQRIYIDSRFFEMPFSRRKRIALHLSEGIAHMHSLGLIHRDLSLKNILLHRKGDELTVKICDMGLASDSSFQACNALQASFAAPEGWDAKMTSTALDIYSIGVIIFYIFANNYPYQKKLINYKCETDDAFRTRLYNDLYLDPKATTYPIPQNGHWNIVDPDQSFRKPMAMCLASKPELRPTADRLVEMLSSLKLTQTESTQTEPPQPIINDYGCTTCFASLFRWLCAWQASQSLDLQHTSV